MKFECLCGRMIYDITDDHVDKTHLMPDTDWNKFWDSIDAAIEKSGPSPAEKEAACMHLRTRWPFGLMYQCPECRRLYINIKDGGFEIYAPVDEDADKADPDE